MTLRSASKLFDQYADLSVSIATLLPHSTEENANSTQKNANPNKKDKNSYYEDALNAYATILKAMQGDPKKNRFSIPTYCYKWCVCRLAQCDHVATTRDVPMYREIEMDTYRQSEMPRGTLDTYIQNALPKYTLLFDLNEAIRKGSREMIDEILLNALVDEWQKNVFDDIRNKYEPKDDEFA